MNAKARAATGTLSERLNAALNLPSGARFYRCALQVNPYDYVRRHSKATSFSTEAEYNAAIVAACEEADVEVIGVTDHYRVHESAGLVHAARSAGLFAFTGFEAVTKDGVHFLCLFDAEKEGALERYIGDCGVHDTKTLSPTGSLDSMELPVKAKEWGAICIAAHVAGDGGLLRKLSGQPRVNAWTSPVLLACALAGPVSNAPDNLRAILGNKDADHRRNRPVAILNASDVSSPDDLKKEASSCYIKMSHVSVEALRQAFLDPESRIRLSTDPQPEPHAEFLAVAWDGGFLGGAAVHFSGNLNVLVGGRGTGKSTLIESMRYALGLDPLGDEAKKAHEGIVRHVLRPGTKVSLLVRSHKPAATYTIERSVPNPPIVKDESGEVLTVSPKDIVPGVEVFGQHEISELAKSPEKQTLLLGRFVDRDPSLFGRKAKLRLDLERSRARIVELGREMRALDERLATLPGLEETQKRYQEAGLEERLKEKSQVIKEERVFANVNDRLEPLRALHRDITQAADLDVAFLSTRALDGLPNAQILSELEPLLAALGKRFGELGAELAIAIATTENGVIEVKSRWDERRQAIEEMYEKRLRELQKSKIDGAEFISLRRQIEDLRPLRERKDGLQRDMVAQEAHRRKLLSEWEDAKASEYRELQSAAKKVSRKLRDRVRVEVAMAGNREPLERLLRELGGNLSAALDRLRTVEQLSLVEFAQKCREGKEALRQYGLPVGSAERISQAEPDLIMRIEELDLPATTRIELNTAADDDPPTWQTLEALSTGQKATAVLLLLLLESSAPLVVDQPEDDLDNRFITDGVVPIMRDEKRRRQFLFSTHNANIPVLGDAELILGLSAAGEGKEGRAEIATEHMGSIDSSPIQELVEEILEGGRDAFEMRRSKYGF